GQPASWRIFGAPSTIQVWLEGPTGVAARRRILRPPGPGFVRELDLVAARAHPITGRITRPEDASLPAPPSLAGVIQVTEIRDSGQRIPYDPVRVADDGRFEIPYTGQGHYQMEPVLGFLEAEGRRVEGGEQDVALPVTRQRPWLVIPTRTWGAMRAGAQARVLELPDLTPAHVPHGLHVGEAAWAIALPGAGTYRLEIAVPPTRTRPPARGTAEVLVSGPGPHEVRVDLDEAPHGKVRVRLRSRAEGRAGGRVEVLHPSPQSATVLPGMTDEAVFPFVEAGDVRLRVTWRDAKAATTYLAARVEAGGQASLEAEAIEGGHLRVTLPPGALADRVEDLRIEWAAGGSPWGPVAGTLLLRRAPSGTDWMATEALAPGTWHARLGRHGAPAEDDLPLDFVIRAGETTTVGAGR
ncbi:MAG: hypothetical protein ACC662_10515, partial [Planctomycetota bacterium]